MTRKDYELIASVLKHSLATKTRQERPEPARLAAGEAVTYVAEIMAHELEHTNPRFDRDRFLRACGVEG